jgi:hypothetical protein
LRGNLDISRGYLFVEMDVVVIGDSVQRPGVAALSLPATLRQVIECPIGERHWRVHPVTKRIANSL